MNNQKNNDQHTDKDKKPMAPKDDHTKTGENKPAEHPANSQRQNG